MGLDEIIYTASIRIQHHAIGGRKCAPMRLGNSTHAQTARLTIAVESRRANNFGKFSASQTAQRIHLPQPVLSRNVALQEDCVFPRSSADVGHAASIPLD